MKIIKDAEFRKFFMVRLGAGILVATILLVGIILATKLYQSKFGSKHTALVNVTDASDTQGSDHEAASEHVSTEPSQPPAPGQSEHQQETSKEKHVAMQTDDSEHSPAHTSENKHQAVYQEEESEAPAHQKAAHDQSQAKRFSPRGVAFLSAAMAPLSYEINERWYGWRPNDIFDFTDNVNNYQLGVLEATRRTVEVLTENISRTGSTDAFVPELEKAMNWLIGVNADALFWPSAENSYNNAMKSLASYQTKLQRGEARFYSRADNLIPLLAKYVLLLGSCDENLVKFEEENGDSVSFFKVDDYFYYAQGVASAIGPILEAIMVDFNEILKSRHGLEDLHHAILSCQRAAQIKPWVITDCDLDSIFANHRANMAAPISHAKFYLENLIKTLST